MKRNCLSWLIVVTCSTILHYVHAAGTDAQAYPVKPIRFVVPYSPGGGADTIARMVAAGLTQNLGQQVIVENRTGADGRVGTEFVARAAPDGYTVIMVTNFHSIAPSAYLKLPYDPVKDFAGVSLASSSPNMLVVHPSVPARSVQELVKLAKARPGQINCGTAGLAQTPHINLEILKMMARVDITLVPFKGGGDAIAAAVGGHVDMAFAAIPGAVANHKAGRLRALGITSAERSPLAPEVPTMVEAGFPGFVNVTWQGILAPVATPRQIIARLNAEVVKVLKSPDMRERILRTGLEPITSTPEEFDGYIKTEIARLGKVLKAAGIKPE